MDLGIFLCEISEYFYSRIRNFTISIIISLRDWRSRPSVRGAEGNARRGEARRGLECKADKGRE